MDVLGDSVSASLLEEADVETERGVILEEIAAAADEPSEVVYEHFNRTLFGDGALGRDIAGSAESVRAMTADQIRGFYRRHYLPENLVVCAAGGVGHADFVKLVREAFAPLEGGPSVPPQRPADGALPERPGGWRSCATTPSRPTWSSAAGPSSAATSGCGP
ncbi:hypothetical protein GCM10029992_61960 [Glycomyces albus]